MEKILETAYTFLAGLVVTILAFLTPVIPLFAIVFSLVVFDTIYAVKSKVKRYGWEIFRSTKLFNIAVKLFFYLGSMIFAYLIDYYVIVDNHIQDIPLILTKAVTLMWVGIELKSLDETSQDNGNKPAMKVIMDVVKQAKKLKKDLTEDEQSEK